MWQKITRCRPVARCSQVYIEGGLVSSGGIKCLKCGYSFCMGHHFQSSARALVATLCCTLHFILHTQYTTGFSFDPCHDLQVPPWTIPHHTPTHTITPTPTTHTHTQHTILTNTHTTYTHHTAQYTHTYCRRVLICIIHNRERHVYIKALNFLSRYNRLIGQFLANYLLVEMKQRGSHRRMYTCPVMPQIRASYTCSLDPPTQHT